MAAKTVAEIRAFMASNEDVPSVLATIQPTKTVMVRDRALARVWRKIITSAAHYSITQTGPHLTLTKRLDVLRRALEAAYEAGAKSARQEQKQAQ